MSTRRDVLWALGAAAASLGLPRRVTAAAGKTVAPSTLRGIGVQLYLLRAAMRDNPEATIARIAALGVREIEWWGDYGRTPQQLKALLDAHGLRSPAVHVDANALRPDRLEATLASAAAMGQRHVIVPSTNRGERSVEGYTALARLLGTAGRAGASRGIRAGFHNHDYDLAPLGDSTLWDVLARESDPSVVDLELDCYWAYKAGHEPLQVIRRYGARITHLHIKDSGGPPAHEMRDAGAGVIDWKAVIDAGTALGVRHAFVEHDAPADAWASAEAGVQHLKALGY